MGIFRGRKSKRRKTRPVTLYSWVSVDVHTTGSVFGLPVVGESYYQEPLKTEWNYGTRIIECVIIPEPDNPYDPNAIMVMMLNSDENCLHLVGYVDKDTAAASKNAMALLPGSANGFSCQGQMRMNPDIEDSMIGVWLNLPLES